MKKLKLKLKEGKEFTSLFGSNHSEAVIVVSAINNDISNKKLDIFFLVYNTENDLDKQPIDNGFMLSFDEIKNVKTIVNPDTGEVLQWGTPTYTEVLSFFSINAQGIVLNSSQVEMWFLNKVEFKGEKLVNNWEIA